MNSEQINQMFNYEKMERMKSQEALRILRQERDRLLSETDWITIRSYSQGVPVPKEWADYQQALRDLPQTCTPTIGSFETNELGIDGVNWPIKPE